LASVYWYKSPRFLLFSPAHKRTIYSPRIAQPPSQKQSIDINTSAEARNGEKIEEEEEEKGAYRTRFPYILFLFSLRDAYDVVQANRQWSERMTSPCRQQVRWIPIGIGANQCREEVGGVDPPMHRSSKQLALHRF